MSQTVVAIFNSKTEAQDAVDDLVNNGISQQNVDYSSSGTQTGSVGSAGSTNLTGLSGSTTSADHEESGITKFFKNLFGSDHDDSTRYAAAAGTRTVVTVHASNEEEAQRAANILDDNGAVDVNEGFDQSSDFTATGHQAANMSATTDATNASGTDTRSIPIIEETLQVGKKVVETGGVRVRSRIVEKPVEESLRLREEYVRVERNPVDRVATTADLANFQEGTIELVQHTEIPVVAKESRVVEEVSLGKEVEHREETIRDTVRNTEVDVEKIESDKTKGTSI